MYKLHNFLNTGKGSCQQLIVNQKQDTSAIIFF